ncbi:MAG: 16S rRNA (cytosine(1402)-N(4))-methyltransferase RsmH [Clostridiales bacterium]|nr:16S rRNA (cytosine(1402)-N(4))-methyltransferase RsmH [Clostridiales bacterium]MDY5513286.1 16S rRNA (cytosine(1402)-N(4))-methyltransferase RsmH [Candidatus Ventricola sp.]
MSFNHVSVMLGPTVDLLGVREGGVYVDGTLGGGGHSAEILRRLNGTGHLYGIDRDNDALAAATARLGGAGNFTAIKGNFHDVRTLLEAQGVSQIDGMMIDLGVSSYQLDTAERGFSYHADAPLDMRMDQDQALTAADIVNTWPREELTRILRDYAEEKWAARIAEIILEHRAKKPLETTGDLVACVDAAIPKKIRQQDSGHSARRTFQALRIAVNDELDPLRQALEDMVELLAPGGHLAVLTFHSLEDRIVKQTFRRLANPCTCPPKIPVCICGKKPVVRVLGGGGIKPDREEIERNPRSRSAMLRGCEKL